MGRLSQKIHSHASPSATAPPTSGPAATAMPVMALYMPIAAPLRSGGKAAVSRASASVETRAAGRDDRDRHVRIDGSRAAVRRFVRLFPVPEPAPA